MMYKGCMKKSFYFIGLKHYSLSCHSIYSSSFLAKNCIYAFTFNLFALIYSGLYLVY